MSPRKKARILKILFFIGTGIVLLLVLIQIFANIYLKEIFRKNINDIKKKISTAYRIEYESITANILNRSLTLKNFRLIKKNKNIPVVDKESSEKSQWFELHLPVIKVTGIGLLKAIQYRSLSVKNVLIKDGKLRVIQTGSSVESKQVKILKRNIFVLNKFFFTQIGVEKIKINNFTFESQRSGLNSKKAKIYKFSLRLTDSRVKIKKLFNYKSKLSFEGFWTNVEDLEVIFPGKWYILRVKNVLISESLSRIKLTSLKLIPAFEKYIFSRKKGHRISRIKWEVDRLNFYNIKLKDIFNKRCFKSDLLTITGSRIHFFRDRRILRRPKVLLKKFPQKVFRELKYNFDIKKIKVRDGNISYEEHQTGFNDPGKIDFKDVNIVAINISNHPDILKSVLPMTVKFRSLFLGKSLFKTSFVVPIHDENDSFFFSGSLEKMKIVYLNPILKNSFLKVERGTVNKLFFSGRGNRYRARGTLRFYYNDLKVSLMKKRSRIKRDGAASFIANKFLRNDNPKRGRSLRVGYMYYKRSQTESIFKLIWKSLLSGVKSSVGL